MKRDMLVKLQTQKQIWKRVIKWIMQWWKCSFVTQEMI